MYALAAAIILLQRALAAAPGAAQNAAYLFTGAFLALGAWTRPEGLLMCWIVAGLGIAWNIPSIRKTRNPAPLAYLLAPLCLYTIFWIVASRLIYPPSDRNSAMYQGAITQLMSGNLHIVEARVYPEPIFPRSGQPGRMGCSRFWSAPPALAREGDRQANEATLAH